ncbi:MAG: DUF2207 domain-containing protein [Chloroflexi bacterium]|nr:DUF2207 domain-containing protein [Chloroflexota bacterium]MCC6893503.1 DUF2207 domain-containing protein [Anaerolineae bacterium]
MQKRVFVTLLFLLLALTIFSPISAQDRTIYWNRYDVTIDNVDVTDNAFDVTEHYDIDFNGTFRFGTAVVPLDNLDSITNVEVRQDGQALEARCGSERAGTFCARNTSDGLEIVYYFFQSITNASEQFDISYRVNGALRVYEGGDQLWWIAVPPDRFGFSVGESTITVEMPSGSAPREGVDPVETYGVPGTVDVRGTTITATANTSIPDGDTFEIRVQYPHNASAVPPDWQNSFDQQRDYDENTKPLIDLGILALSVLIAIGGTLGIYAIWYTRGRDPKVGPVPTYLSDPPDQLSPAIVGTLIDEKADVQDVISILIDLAHRGYMVMEENQEPGLFGLGNTSKFTFKRTDKPADDLKAYEARMLNALFARSMERTMDSLKNSFYTVISSLQGELYKALVSEGLFSTNPQTTRAGWSGLGVLLLVVAGGVFFFASGVVDDISSTLLFLPFAIGFVGVAALIAGQVMPAKTRKGAEEAAKWRAFYEYLQNLEKYSDVEEASKHFDDYLPYAVAFGLDRAWVRRFSQVQNVPIPYWYYPTYMGGRYHGGYHAGSPFPSGNMGGSGLPGDIARAPGGLDTMSRNLSGGLENISSGLTNMLQSASRVMTSQPQSSSGGSGRWSSGGRGFSGGGFSGGGGSGGGSRGFG